MASSSTRWSETPENPEGVDPLPLSALQHLLFCERQCALIHVEGQWAENRLTVEGGHLHERTHEAGPDSRAGVRVVRGLRLCSRQLGLRGQADVVEFHHSGSGRAPPRTCDVLSDGLWRPFPVEYKRGKPKADESDRVQLCAQGLCLEEMLQREVPAGALFYGRTRRRLDVTFDAGLRDKTNRTAQRLHELIREGRTPAPEPGPKCRRCSLADLCLPGATGPRRSATRFLQRNVALSAPEAPCEDAAP